MSPNFALFKYGATWISEDLFVFVIHVLYVPNCTPNGIGERIFRRGALKR